MKMEGGGLDKAFTVTYQIKVQESDTEGLLRTRNQLFWHRLCIDSVAVHDAG